MKFTTKELNLLLCLISNYDTYDTLIESENGEPEKYHNLEKEELKESITTRLKYGLLQEQDK